MIEKSKAIVSAVLYHVDISKRYFLVCHLKVVFYFLHELKERSGDVTGRHLTAGRFRRYWGSNNNSKLLDKIHTTTLGDVWKFRQGNLLSEVVFLVILACLRFCYYVQKGF